jgi:PAS domain S-box-containing protein
MKNVAIKINRKHFFFNIILPTFLTIALFILLIFVFIVPYFEKNMLDGKKEMIRQLVVASISIATKYEQEAAAGNISIEEAKEKSLVRINHMRYGVDNKDYFWITDLHPTMIMHPYRSDLNGTDLSDFTDPNGKKLFVEFVSVVKQNGEGYVDYMWQWMDDPTRIVPKISYVKEFKPWGWIVGTGIYIEDVKMEILAIEKRLIGVSLGISALMALLLTFIVRQNLRAEIKRTEAERELHESREKYKVLVEAANEGTGMIMEGRWIYSNKKLQEMIDCSPNNMISDDLNEIIHRDKTSDQLKLREFQKGDSSSMQIETQVITKSQTSVTVLLSISKITLYNKKGLIVIVKDLTVDDEVEINLAERGKELLRLSELLSIGFIRFLPGRKGRILEANNAAVRMLGAASKEDVVHLDIFDLIEDGEEKERFLKTLAAQGIVKEYPLRIRTNSTGQRILSVSATVVKDELGVPRYTEGIIEDITEHRKRDEIQNELLIEMQTASMFMNQKVTNVLKKIVSCEMNHSIMEAAALMTNHKSSVIILRSPENEFIGILTDHDIRERVVAGGLDTMRPAYEIMSSPIHFIDENATLSDALIKMKRAGVSRLVVKNAENQIAGYISRNTIDELRHSDHEAFVNSIQTAVTVDELNNHLQRMMLLVNAMVESGARTTSITKLITAVADAITEKLAGIVIAELGKPPVPFAFVALGSEGRSEQTLLTDQDNALIYSDNIEIGSDIVKNYFLSFGERINTLLDKVGYSLCKGGVMAQNPRWNQSLSTWKKYFTEWIVTPEPQNLLDLSIFFDIRCVYGDKSLVDELIHHINQALSQHPPFFGSLARVCMNYKIPLGIFGKIHTESSEDHGKSVNVKNPARVIVNLVRLYTMHRQIVETNTIRRLDYLYEKNVLSGSIYRDLKYAFDFLMMIQFRSQALASNAGKKMDHNVDLTNLTSIEVKTLKSIFSQIAVFQSKLKHDFGINE